MATAGSIITRIQKLFGDTAGDFISDTFGLDWLSQGERRFTHKVLPLDEFKDYTITAKQPRFDLPTNCIIPIQLMWFKQRTAKLDYQPPDVWAKVIEAMPNSTGTPDAYSVVRRQVVVGPQVPTTASANTTASGTITAAATTIGLVAASGTFRSKGWVKINSEVIEYTGVATTTLTGAVRGVHGTTAASHASGDTVTEIDLQMLYRKAPANLTATTASPEIPDMFHDYLEKYALYLAWVARGDLTKAQLAYTEFEALEEGTIKTVGRRSQDGLLKIQDKRNRWRGRW